MHNHCIKIIKLASSQYDIQCILLHADHGLKCPVLHYSICILLHINSVPPQVNDYSLTTYLCFMQKGDVFLGGDCNCL